MCGRYFFDLESELLQNYYREAQTKQPEAGSRISSWRSFSVKSCCDVKKRGRKHPHSGNHEVGIYRI